MTATIQNSYHTYTMIIHMMKYMLIFTTSCCLHWPLPVVIWLQLQSHFAAM